MEEWLTTKEAAAYLKVHPKTIYRYVKIGALRQYQPVGVGRPRFRREDLEAVLLGGAQNQGQPDANREPVPETTEEKENSQLETTENIGGFGFRSPLRSLRRSLSEDEQLRGVLTAINELRAMVEALIAQRRNQL